MEFEVIYINSLSESLIKGYKSLYNVKLKLSPGLNILIGKNGSGKSNFIESLNTCFNETDILQIDFGKLKFISNTDEEFLWNIKKEETIKIKQIKNESQASLFEKYKTKE